MLIVINDLLFSFVQVRGSVPLFWEQVYSYGMAKSTRIHRSIEENYKAIELHFHNLLKKRGYRKIVLLNLLSSNNALESKLIQNYEYLLRKLEGSSLIKSIQKDIQKDIEKDIEKDMEKEKGDKINNNNNNNNNYDNYDNIKLKPSNFVYYYFDMHKNCEGKDYRAFNSLLGEAPLKQSLRSCGFTTLQMKGDGNYEILYTQQGVVRTNCSSCIDRTNIAQSRIAAFHILYIFHRIDIKIEDFDENLSFMENEEPFAVLYRNLWADNGDNLSKQYTGTHCMESFALRQGKLSYMTSFDHGLTSISRALRSIRHEDQ